MIEPIALNQPYQALSDATNRSRTLIYQSSEQLGKGCAETYFGVGVLGRANPACAYDGVSLSIHTAERLADAGVG